MRLAERLSDYLSLFSGGVSENGLAGVNYPLRCDTILLLREFLVQQMTRSLTA